MTENDKDYFEPIDVSEPRAPRREMEIIEEALAIRRRDWIKTHMSYIYTVIGIIVVALIAIFIYVNYINSNPLRCFSNSLSKDFGTSFDYTVKMTEDNETVMSYTGSIDVNRSRHEVKALYQADYNRYTFTGAVFAEGKNAVRGSLYDKKWTVHECSDMVLDFFDFDADFRNGGFDGGAFLRFTGLTSDYSIREVNHFTGILRNRLSTDSSIAEISTEQTDEGTRYHYDINLHNIFEMVEENGASVFYRSTDYDKFSAMFNMNESVLENAKCTADFVVDPSGYMTKFDMNVVTLDKVFGLSCRMSNFGSAHVEIPAEFLKAAMIPATEE